MQNKRQSIRDLRRVVFLVAVVALPSQVFAESATGTASVEIRQPVAVSQTVPMTFGVISTYGADVVTITPAGSISSQNGANLSAGSSNSGQFSAAGTANTNVIISFSNGVLTGLGAPMAVNNLTHDGGLTPSFSAAGVLSFAVGADLVINADQTPGTYTGTYEVSVNYQ